MDLGPDPVDREGDEPDAERGVEALDRLHEPDAAFLDEVRLRQAVAGVSAGDPGDEAKVREDQAPGRVEIFVVAILLGEMPLLVFGEHGDGVHRLEVRLEAASRRRDCER